MTYLDEDMQRAVVPASAPHPSPARRLVPWLAAGSAVALLLRQQDTRRHLGEAAASALDHTRDDLHSAADRAQPLVQQVQETVLPAVSDVLSKVTQTALPVAGTIAAQAKDAVQGVREAARHEPGVGELRDRIQDTAQHVQTTTRQAQGRAERKLEERKIKMDAKKEAVAAAVLAKQEKQLHDLQLQVNTLMRTRTRSGGSFPWGLALLVGGGYYLYRSNPTVRDQINGLLKRVSPGIEGNLARAGDAAKDAVGAVMRGDDASGAAKDAYGELKRAGEKTADAAQDKLHDLGRDAKQAAQDVKDDAQRAADRAKDDVGRR